METFSALLAICAGNSPVPTQRPVTRSFDDFFDLRLKKRLSKQSWGWWFETQSLPLWRHCNEANMCICVFPLFLNQRHDAYHPVMMTSSICEGNLPVTGPVTRSSDVFFDLHLNKLLSKRLRHHRAHYYATVICSLFHGWWPDDPRNQCISTHVIQN